MKNKFGIDVSGNIPAEPKYEKALTEAWDYFKEKASELDDAPGDQRSIQRTKFLRATVSKSVQSIATLLMQGNEHQGASAVEY